MACQRCNDMSPDGFDVDRLRAIDAAYVEATADAPFPVARSAIGLASRSIIDAIYRFLNGVPTDALMRELARRFL